MPITIKATKAIKATLVVAALLLTAGCSGGGSSSVPAAKTSGATAGASSGASSVPNYAQDISAAASWIVTSAQLPDGAIESSSTAISPYFANRAAHGLALTGRYDPQVRAWMQWYVAHLNVTDAWGGTGTIYDYSVAGGQETSLGTADSTDAYAATFLSLALAYYQTSDASAQAYVLSIRPALDTIAGVLVTAQQSDGLTWAKPNYQIKYLMDNCEVYHGLQDYATLLASGFGDASGAAAYRARAASVASGIEAELWNPSANVYYNYVGASGSRSPVDWTNYESSAAELFPVLHGLIAPSSARAQTLYADFNTAFPAWDQLKFPDAYPWALVSTAAAMMGDTARAQAYVVSVEKTYEANGFPYPWYSGEGGWFVETGERLSGGL